MSNGPFIFIYYFFSELSESSSLDEVRQGTASFDSTSVCLLRKIKTPLEPLTAQYVGYCGQ